jgi:hypothetical protein
MMTAEQQEIERLKQEVVRLQKELAARDPNPPPVPGFITGDSLINNFEFVTDMARFSESIYTEQQVKKKWRFDDKVWERLGSDDVLVEKIELERAARIRSGAAKREKAQLLVVEAPGILGTLMRDEKASAKHRVDAIKTLDAFAGNGPAAAAEAEKFFITITLSADERLTFGGPIKPTPNSGAIIDTTRQDLTAREENSDGGPL